jgi:quinol monooxygenase YgiN
MLHMRRTLPMWVLAAVALTLGMFGNRMVAQQAQPGQPDPLQAPKVVAPLYVLTFADVFPQNTVAGKTAIQQYAADTRKDPGIQRVEVIAQVGGHANHMVIIEVWKDEASFNKHEAAPHTLDYRAKMQPLLGAPFDQRFHFLLQ